MTAVHNQLHKKGGTIIQILQFESAWDKTLAPQDREEMINFFHTCIPRLDAGVHFSFFRKAINHKGDLLVTVLIHNLDDNVLTLKDTVITYKTNEEIIAKGTFSVPLAVQATTSMPWTFIFSQSKQVNKSTDYIISHNPTLGP